MSEPVAGHHDSEDEMQEAVGAEVQSWSAADLETGRAQSGPLGGQMLVGDGRQIVDASYGTVREQHRHNSGHGKHHGPAIDDDALTHVDTVNRPSHFYEDSGQSSAYQSTHHRVGQTLHSGYEPQGGQPRPQYLSIEENPHGVPIPQKSQNSGRHQPGTGSHGNEFPVLENGHTSRDHGGLQVTGGMRDRPKAGLPYEDEETVGHQWRAGEHPSSSRKSHLLPVGREPQPVRQGHRLVEWERQPSIDREDDESQSSHRTPGLPGLHNPEDPHTRDRVGKHPPHHHKHHNHRNHHHHHQKHHKHHRQPGFLEGDEENVDEGTPTEPRTHHSPKQASHTMTQLNPVDHRTTWEDTSHSHSAPNQGHPGRGKEVDLSASYDVSLGTNEPHPGRQKPHKHAHVSTQGRIHYPSGEDLLTSGVRNAQQFAKRVHDSVSQRTQLVPPGAVWKKQVSLHGAFPSPALSRLAPFDPTAPVMADPGRPDSYGPADRYPPIGGAGTHHQPANPIDDRHQPETVDMVDEHTRQWTGSNRQSNEYTVHTIPGAEWAATTLLHPAKQEIPGDHPNPVVHLSRKTPDVDHSHHRPFNPAPYEEALEADLPGQNPSRPTDREASVGAWGRRPAIDNRQQPARMDTVDGHAQHWTGGHQHSTHKLRGPVWKNLETSQSPAHEGLPMHPETYPQQGPSPGSEQQGRVYTGQYEMSPEIGVRHPDSGPGTRQPNLQIPAGQLNLGGGLKNPSLDVPRVPSFLQDPTKIPVGHQIVPQDSIIESVDRQASHWTKGEQSVTQYKTHEVPGGAWQIGIQAGGPGQQMPGVQPSQVVSMHQANPQLGSGEPTQINLKNYEVDPSVGMRAPDSLKPSGQMSSGHPGNQKTPVPQEPLQNVQHTATLDHGRPRNPALTSPQDTPGSQTKTFELKPSAQPQPVEQTAGQPQQVGGGIGTEQQALPKVTIQATGEAPQKPAMKPSETQPKPQGTAALQSTVDGQGATSNVVQSSQAVVNPLPVTGGPPTGPNVVQSSQALVNPLPATGKPPTGQNVVQSSQATADSLPVAGKLSTGPSVVQLPQATADPLPATGRLPTGTNVVQSSQPAADQLPATGAVPTGHLPEATPPEKQQPKELEDQPTSEEEPNEFGGKLGTPETEDLDDANVRPIGEGLHVADSAHREPARGTRPVYYLALADAEGHSFSHGRRPTSDEGDDYDDDDDDVSYREKASSRKSATKIRHRVKSKTTSVITSVQHGKDHSDVNRERSKGRKSGRKGKRKHKPSILYIGGQKDDPKHHVLVVPSENLPAGRPTDIEGLPDVNSISSMQSVTSRGGAPQQKVHPPYRIYYALPEGKELPITTRQQHRILQAPAKADLSLQSLANLPQTNTALQLSILSDTNPIKAAPILKPASLISGPVKTLISGGKTLQGQLGFASGLQGLAASASGTSKTQVGASLQETGIAQTLLGSKSSSEGEITRVGALSGTGGVIPVAAHGIVNAGSFLSSDGMLYSKFAKNFKAESVSGENVHIPKMQFFSGLNAGMSANLQVVPGQEVNQPDKGQLETVDRLVSEQV